MLNNDKFLLCYGTSNYIGVTKDQLSLVDGEGRLVKRWSNQSEESKETCNMTHFALDANGGWVWVESFGCFGWKVWEVFGGSLGSFGWRVWEVFELFLER